MKNQEFIEICLTKAKNELELWLSSIDESGKQKYRNNLKTSIKNSKKKMAEQIDMAVENFLERVASLETRERAKPNIEQLNYCCHFKKTIENDFEKEIETIILSVKNELKNYQKNKK